MGFRKKKEDYSHIAYEADEGYGENYTHDESYENSPYTMSNTTEPAVKKERKVKEAKNGKSTIPLKAWIIAGSYILFLIIGIITTTYGPGNDGKKHAQVISVSLRQEREEYYSLKEHYLALKDIIEAINKIDRQLKESSDPDTYSFSLKYESLLPAINKDETAAKNLGLTTHGSLKALLITVYEDSINYLSKRTNSLTRKDKNMFLESEELKKSLDSDFLQLAEDMKSVSKRVMLDDGELYDVAGKGK